MSSKTKRTPRIDQDLKARMMLDKDKGMSEEDIAQKYDVHVVYVRRAIDAVTRSSLASLSKYQALLFSIYILTLLFIFQESHLQKELLSLLTRRKGRLDTARKITLMTSWILLDLLSGRHEEPKGSHQKKLMSNWMTLKWRIFHRQLRLLRWKKTKSWRKVPRRNRRLQKRLKYSQVLHLLFSQLKR